MGLRDEYDPEKRLWVCGRRSFLFLSGMTALGAALGVRPDAGADLGRPSFSAQLKGGR